jgi:hypothetical protein
LSDALENTYRIIFTSSVYLGANLQPFRAGGQRQRFERVVSGLGFENNRLLTLERYRQSIDTVFTTTVHMPTHRG